MIKLTLIGNLGRDATINNVGGKTVINFPVAHSEKYKDQQGNLQDRVVWVDCAFWTERNVGNYLVKGKTVYVEGTPHVEVYTTKEGKQGASLRLRVLDMQFVGGNGANRDGGAPQQPQSNNITNDGGMTANNTPTAQPVAAAAPNNDFDAGDLPF